VILAVFATVFFDLRRLSRHHPLAKQKRFNIAGVSKRHERASPGL
jgi:hypothetical protein